jgi:predicted MPP superfamily phosphohydrolase
MHLSDLHGDTLGWNERTVLEVVAKERPDLIVLTGDTSDRGSFATYAPFLSKLHAPLGVYTVQGNWEHWRPAEDEARTFAAAGIELLINDARQARAEDDVWVVGIDDLASGSPNIEHAFRNVPSGAFVIALTHSPALFDDIAGPRVRLAFAGHTHGGQVRFPLLGPLWLPPGSGDYVQGLYSLRGSERYVSRGVGTSILPIRFLCRPEIVLMDVGSR